MTINLTQSPYYDDFDPTKNFYKILYRPSFAVQARELTQSQTILQDQVSKFGNSIYRNGSLVTGGQTVLEVTATKYVCISATDPNGIVVDVTNFIGKFVTDGDRSGIRAYVIAGAQATLTSPTYLILKYTSGAKFDGTQVQPIQTEDGIYKVAILASLTTPVNFTDVTSGVRFGNASICSVDTGVFYVEGYFVQVNPQTVVLDAFDNTPSYRIGLQIDETIVTATQDASLLDPAEAATNFQAPGADRFRIALTLVKRSLSSTDDSKFIELIRVVNGSLTKKVVYPIYSVLDDTLARRTNDQSGSFTVRPFKLSLAPNQIYANAYNIIVEPGKAYVFGYEFETIAPYIIKAERARTAANVVNYNTTIDYQNWLEVTNLQGPIPFKTLQPGVLHCVSSANIAIANAAVAANTLIGTIRIRALDYRSGANATSISTAVWRAYMFDANVGSSLVCNCAATGTSNTMYLAPNFSSIANAYAGVKFTITANATGTLQESHTVGSYDGPNNKVTLQGTEKFAFGIPDANTRYRLNYEFKDMRAIVYANTSVNQNVFSTQMDVAASSRQPFIVDPYQGAFLTDTGFNSLILKFPYPSIADQTVVGGTPITNSNYQGRKIYTGQGFTQNVTTITSAAGITSLLNGALSGSDAAQQVLVIVRNATGSSLANGQVINFQSGNPAGNTVSITTTSNTSTWTITVPNMNSAASADVYVKVLLPFSHSLGNLIRSKTAKIANVASGLNSGGIQIPDPTGLVQWYSQGGGTLGAQITIYANSAAWQNLKDPSKVTSLYTADVIALRKVIDVGTNLITDGNVAFAADITSRYTLDNGQRDNAYNHAGIILNPNSQGPTGNVVIYIDYLAHSGLGYLTVDSYSSANITYANTPLYTSPTTGITYQLRDCIDFRPRRQDADFVGSYDEELFGISGQAFDTTFSYYLARVDKLILTKDRTFEVIQGVSSLLPVQPSDKDNAMTLYTLSLPAYTANTSAIGQTYVDNRRYTMRDIGSLEKRITNLEYYTSLNLLEQAAKNTEIVDDTGANRFKNGILVDPFTGHSIGDVLNPDYKCAMDPRNNEMRPPFHTENLLLNINVTGSTNFARTGSIISLPYTVQTFIDQPLASQAVNVNPFNTVQFIGQITLDPSSDTWVDTNRIPDVNVNLLGDNDAWAALASSVNQNLAGTGAFGTQWNSWQTNWTGVSSTSSILNPWQFAAPGFDSGGLPLIQRTVQTTTQKQSRTGIQTSFAPQTITASIGDKVVDSSVIAKMRSRGIVFVGKMFAPNTPLYAFFDGTAVTGYVNRTNVVQVNSPTVKYTDTYQQNETVRVWDPARGANTAQGVVILNRNESTFTNVSILNVTGGDDANIANAYFVHSTNTTFLIGQTSGANTQITGYYHNSGFVTNPNVSSILLSHDVANSNTGISNTIFVGQTIYFTTANGLGQQSTITSYNANTRNVAFSPSLSVLPNTATSYSIGQMVSDYRGEVSGIFVVPSTTSVSFRTGERQFTLMDTLSGIVAGSETNGAVKFYSAGTLQTVENTTISTRSPGIQRTTVTQNQTVVTTKVSDAHIGDVWFDPLAQTFLIDQRAHPSGVMLTGVRLLFKTKDNNIPVQIQLRPVVNGFPHSSQVLPGTDTVINPSDINVVSEAALSAKYADPTSSNPFDDATMYTQINFGGPVYLAQGTEYAIILITNSVKYQVYISNMGSPVLGTNRVISSPPYLGVFFKSQNSSTWTPVQGENLAFRMLYAQFDPTVQANVEFRLSSAITANVPLDTMFLTSGNLLLPNTTINALYAATTATGNKTDNKSFQLNENVYFDDTLGRRVATSDVNSFKLRFLMSSQSADLSPLVDMDRLSLLAIENKVNTLGLDNTSVVVVASSNNWFNAANLTLTISGGGGSGANAYVANTQIDSNNNILANVVVDGAGSGYTTAPTITLSGNTSLTANIFSVGEDRPSGGPAVARYITRKVTLADGMDAGDFRVYLSAYKPTNANIFVYYRILSADDPDSFDHKNYQLMTIIQGANNISRNQRDIKNFVFAPGANNIAANRVQYDSFVTFKYFAIKVVLTSTDTTLVPRISNFRVVALPALS
jgi:hypothetical protein